MAPRQSVRDRRKANSHVPVRRLRFQTLEDRICLAFTESYDAGTSTLRFEGTAAADVLMDIAVDGTSGNVKYQTNVGAWVETQVPAPTSANPLWISISGLDGDDDVGRAGFPFTLAGFAHYSVAHFTFDGGPGKDRLFSPKWTVLISGIVWSPIVWEEGPTFPSIVFLGKEDRDELWGNNYAEYFDGGADVDKAKGGEGNDHLIGGVHGDILEGEDGDDLIEGGWEVTPFSAARVMTPSRVALTQTSYSAGRIATP